MAFFKSLSALFLLLSLTRAANSQDVAGSVQQQWEAYHTTTLQEKMYVHTDKSTYVAGEIIWFKLYNLDAAQHRPLPLSKIAYVDVLDASGKAVAQAKISLKEGKGEGSVLIPLSITSGNYTFRGYTNWMKNFGAGHFFEKRVPIINTLRNASGASADTMAYQLAVFPEGGNLVNGIESKVAVKVSAPDGKGVDFTGTVLDESGNTVATVSSLKFGAGSFLFTPVSGPAYTLTVALPSGRVLKKELPKAYDQGYVMRVIDAGTQIKVVVSAKTGPGDASGVYLFAHNRNRLEVAEKKDLVNGQGIFEIDKGKIREGITHFTVFNEKRTPVCERLYFKKPVLKALLTVIADQASYGSRKKVNLVVKATGSGAQIAPMDLSLSVYKWDSLQPANSTDIRTYLWLTSELSGTVESPAFYLSDAAGEAADNLMLTQGWRRFRWERVLAAQRPAFSYPLEYNGHLVKAVVTDTRSSKPAPRIPAFLSIPGRPFQFYAAQSDSAGVAQFDIKNYYGAGEIVLQTNTAFDSVYRIEALSPFAQEYSPDIPPVYSYATQHQDALLRQSIGMQVQHVYRRDSMERFNVPDNYDTVSFFGPPDYSYPLDVYTRFGTMEEVLREYVRPINVVQRRNGLHLLIMDENRSRFFEGGELVLLDGIPVFNKNKIFAYDPLKVKKLDVMSRKYFIGPTFFNGIASFTTYTGNYEGFTLDPRSVVIDYEGMQLEREFYAPVYETAQQAGSRVPDFRNTLLWKPQLDFGKGEKAVVEFYTSDQKGHYMVVVEGLDNEGNAAAARFPFEVK
jgi:hypothetical protein